MALDFPASPANGATYAAPNGATYVFHSTPAPGYWTITSAASSALGLVNVMDYGAVGDGVTNDYAAFAAALAALVAAKGGVLWLPPGKTFKLNSSLVINVGLYLAGQGIALVMNGSKILAGHNGITIDVPTNTFGTNNSYGDYGKRVIIDGGGGQITGTATAVGAVRMQDQNFSTIKNLRIDGYPAGYAFQLYITTNDQSTWSESNDIHELDISGCLTGIWFKSFTTVNIANSFLGNSVRKTTIGNDTVNNAVLYNFEGDCVDCLFERIGGYYGQFAATGNKGFVLNGSFSNAYFIGPWVDSGGGGISDPTTDVTFGANYTADPLGFPVFQNASSMSLPFSWNSRLLIPNPFALDGIMSANPRRVLSDDTIFFIRTDGNDGNYGTENTAGGAWLTFAGAIDNIAKMDANGHSITLQLANATYTEPFNLEKMPLGIDQLILLGNTGTPNNVTIRPTNDTAIRVARGSKLVVQGVTVTTLTSGFGLMCEDPGSRLEMAHSSNRIGACASSAVFCTNGGYILFSAACTYSANSATGMECSGKGMIRVDAVITASNRAFSAVFANVYDQAQIMFTATPVKASATGTRYTISTQGLIETFGGGASFLPGSVAGSAAATSFGFYS